MIEKHQRNNASLAQIERINRPEPQVEQTDSEKVIDDAAASVASTFIAHALRPPELRFDDQSRLGGLDFESQAISSMGSLKFSSSDRVVDSLAAIIVQHSADIEKSGSADAKAGLKAVDNFIKRSAQFQTWQTGISG